jgi:hypothetical protein
MKAIFSAILLILSIAIVGISFLIVPTADEKGLGSYAFNLTSGTVYVNYYLPADSLKYMVNYNAPHSLKLTTQSKDVTFNMYNFSEAQMQGMFANFIDLNNANNVITYAPGSNCNYFIVTLKYDPNIRSQDINTSYNMNGVSRGVLESVDCVASIPMQNALLQLYP